MRIVTVVALQLALFGAASAFGQAAPQFDPRSYQSEINGERTRFLVLGTTHLSGVDDLDTAVLEPILDRLENFAPDAILIEGIAGRSIASMWDFRAVQGDTAISYGSRIMLMATAGRVGTRMGMAEAEVEAGRLLEEWPEQPTAAQRRRLAALFATAGNPYSAVVQWTQLDPAERIAEDGIHGSLLPQLNDLLADKNESSSIAAALSARLGLERVYPIDAQDEIVLDDHNFEVFGERVFPPMVERMQADPAGQAFMNASARLDTPEHALEAYRLLNDEETLQTTARIEWLGVMQDSEWPEVGRMRVAAWETRNLRMAANIREVSGRYPGGKILVIVGATHKVWLDAYLGMFTDSEIIDTQEVLR